MAIFVKAYMRNGSSVRAYSRTGKIGRRGANYTKRSMNQMLTRPGVKKMVRRRNAQATFVNNIQVQKQNAAFRAQVFFLQQTRSKTARMIYARPR
jgi:hypothetical protein